MLEPEICVKDMKFGLRSQYLANRGVATINPVYTLEVNNPNYLRVDQSWNWEVQSVDADGTARGTVSQVSCPSAHFKQGVVWWQRRRALDAVLKHPPRIAPCIY